MKVIVGAGTTFQIGWRSFRQEELDLLKPEMWKRLFKPESLDAIMAEHVWEHLTAEEGKMAARICYRYLKRGGHLRLAVPDGLHPDKRYIDFVKPGSWWNGWDHKVLYDYHSLSEALNNAGFRVRLIEYWREDARLVIKPMLFEEGVIRRSVRHLYASLTGILAGTCYTSLIADGVKA